MRNLTRLFVLISFGILAALPFRHNPANSSDPHSTGEATGPTSADLGRTNLDFIVQTDDEMQMKETFSDRLPKWTVPNNSVSTPPIPSTFEDIAVPLKLDAYDEARLSVSATKQKHSMGKSRLGREISQERFAQKRSISPAGDLVAENQPKFVDAKNRFGSSFRSHQGDERYRFKELDPDRPENQRSILETAQDTKSVARNDQESIATLASADVNNAHSSGKSVWREPVERLPNRSADNRKRHWIRQPD